MNVKVKVNGEAGCGWSLGNIRVWKLAPGHLNTVLAVSYQIRLHGGGAPMKPHQKIPSGRVRDREYNWPAPKP